MSNSTKDALNGNSTDKKDTSTGALDSDKLIPTSTIETPYDGYSGRMRIYDSISATAPFTLDIIVQTIAYSIKETIQVDESIGNTFSILPLGMGPMTISISGAVVDTGKTYGKDYFMDYYRNYLRMEAVARRGKMPIYVLPHMAIYGAAVNLVFSETGASEDVVFFTLTLAISKIIISDGTNNASIDYFHGLSQEASIPNTLLSSGSGEGEPKVVPKAT